MIDLDLSRYDRIAARFAEEQREARTFLKNGIATRNAAFNRMIGEIEQVAIASREPMLFMGPTGAGKSSLARKVFELKRGRHQLAGQFVEVNCATLRGDTAASTLFGHVRGAFTGAQRDRPGLLRSADGGLLFLDEIGELGADEQAMLLRALEEKRFLPVGADREAASDFQLIAGTNCDLSGAVSKGRVPRGFAGAHQPVDLRVAGAGATPRGHRAQSRSRVGKRRASAGPARRHGEGRAGGVPGFRAFGRGEVERELPRPERRRHTHGHARAGRPHHA